MSTYRCKKNTQEKRIEVDPLLPGKKESESIVFGVRGGDVFWVAVIPPTESAREGNRRETALGYHTPWRIDTQI